MSRRTDHDDIQSSTTTTGRRSRPNSLFPPSVYETNINIGNVNTVQRNHAIVNNVTNTNVTQPMRRTRQNRTPEQ